MLERLRTAIDRYRERVVTSTTDLFAHADYPLENTLAHTGDPGLFGPESVTWPVLGDVAAFVGGIRALLVQSAHPEVAAGVAEHSRYRTDPLGRLSRTSAYVTAVGFGAEPEVEAAVQVVRNAHKAVRGRSHRGRPYSAGNPGHAAWVHNVLTDSFLAAYQAFGPRRLSGDEADRFVAEQTKVGRLLDAGPLPATAADLADWVNNHEQLGPSPGLVEARSFLQSPPLPVGVRLGYKLLYAAAVATIPGRLRGVLGIRRVPGALLTGRLITRLLRWALGSSPSWHLALVRVRAPVPDGLFRQPLQISQKEV